MEPDSLWIISNDAALMTSGNIERAEKLKYPFKGTLIMYTISLDLLDDSYIEDNLTL